MKEGTFAQKAQGTMCMSMQNIIRTGVTGCSKIQSREETNIMTIDKRWFTSQVHEHQDELYRLAYHILQGKEDAEDALQEALFRAYTNLWQLKQPKYFKTWMTKILMNTCFDIQRKQKNNLDIDEYKETLGKSEDMTTKVIMEKAIRELEELNQQIILLFYYEDYSIKEISGVLNVSVMNVKQRLSRSRKMLRDILEGGKKGV